MQLPEVGNLSQERDALPCVCRGCTRVTFDATHEQLCGPCFVGNHGHLPEHRCPATDIIDKLSAHILANYPDLVTAGRDPADIAIIVMGRAVPSKPPANWRQCHHEDCYSWLAPDEIYCPQGHECY